MDSRISPESVYIDVEKNKSHEEDMEKKAVQTIYAQLKQATCACKQNSEKHWTKCKDDLSNFKYKNSKKEIIQKLDEENNYAPIHYAVISNNKFIFKQLLTSEFKCNVNLLGWDGQSPLHLAACSLAIENEMKETIHRDSDASILMTLLQYKAAIDIQDDKGRTPLHHAIMRNHSAIIKILLDYEANPLKTDIQGATCIHYAYRFSNAVICKNFFPLQTNYKLLKTKDGKTPFDFAAEYGRVDCIKDYFQSQPISRQENLSIYALIQSTIRSSNSDPTFISKRLSLIHASDKRYMLELACQHFDGDKLLTDPTISKYFNSKFFLQENPNDGFTPLMIAVKHRREKCVKALLQHPMCTKDILEAASHDFERTVLHICAEYPNESIANALLGKAKSYELDLAPIDIMGNTPLHICAEKNNIFMCQGLLANIHPKPVYDLLEKKNNNGLTAFHIAVKKKHTEIVNKMLQSTSGCESDLIKYCDQELRTSLHIAAFEGSIEIVELFLKYKLNVDIPDINDHTPLHEAARWSDSTKDNNQCRKECINRLIKAGADIDALNIRRESPLHIACRFGSPDLVKALLDHGANYLQTNLESYNCLEVAIEEKNDEVVEYLIAQDYIFELMRNAQIYDDNLQPCCSFGSHRCRTCCCIPMCRCLDKCSFYTCRLGLDVRQADTPMRKLIVNMPDMALKVLDKCKTTIGSDKSQVHQEFFDYEFLEDQYAVRRWARGNINNSSSDEENEIDYENEPYSYDYKTLVMRHPLFMMAVYNRYNLMTHPVCKSLVNKKFYGFDLIIFLLIFVTYGIFLGTYTTIVLRTTHPEVYYNLTGFPLDVTICSSVIAVLEANSSLISYDNNPLKETADVILRNTLYATMALIGFKIFWYMIAYIRIHWGKAFTFILEALTLMCCAFFIYDESYQQKYRMRCFGQWNFGAYGIFTGYIALFYYIQHLPILGIYVFMMKQILIRFLLFLPVLMVLVCGFTLALYMTFPNFDAFSNFAGSLSKTAIMSIGEINYDDLMHNKDTPAFYPVGYILLPFFAVVMTILAANLLIGLAVGDVGPALLQAKKTRIDMFYELTAELEILKLQILFLLNRCCKCCFISPAHYKKSDLNKQWKWFHSLKRRLLRSCAREVDDEDVSDESDDDDAHNKIIEEIRNRLQPIQSGPDLQKNKNHQNTKAKHIKK